MVIKLRSFTCTFGCPVSVNVGLTCQQGGKEEELWWGMGLYHMWAGTAALSRAVVQSNHEGDAFQVAFSGGHIGCGRRRRRSKKIKN